MLRPHMALDDVVNILTFFFCMKNWGTCGKMETSSHKENFIMRVKLEAFALKSALTIFNQMPVEIFPSKFKTKNVGLAFLSIQLPSVF